MAYEILVWMARERDERLAYDRLHLAVTLLHVHHHCDRYTTGNPLVSWQACVLYA